MAKAKNGERADRNWERFHLEKGKINYPEWPNEVMVKVLFGDYLKRKVALNSESKVLDIGCGFGNNLLPFLKMGCACYGVEVTKAMARTSQDLLRNRGYGATIEVGRNTHLPFPDEHFDLCISINALHYEKNEKDIKAGLAEYCRVLKGKGALFLTTVGPVHGIYEKAEIVGPHQFRIQNFDFRDGEQYFYFSNLKYFNHYLSQFFEDIELGRVTERLMTENLDFLIAVCREKRNVDIF